MVSSDHVPAPGGVSGIRWRLAYFPGTMAHDRVSIIVRNHGLDCVLPR